jgi:hypothetical protein
MYHTCGLTPDGVGYCWGRNDTGELGVRDYALPAPVLGTIVFAKP